MRQYICDFCGVVKQVPIKVLKIPIHIEQPNSGYTDGDFNDVSGVCNEYDACQKCYNKAYTAMWDAINESTILKLMKGR